MGLTKKLEEKLPHLEGEFSLSDIYALFPDEKRTTIRGRIYKELMGSGKVSRISKDLYIFDGNSDAKGAVLHGDARKLDCINDESIDLLIADHPYEIETSGAKKLTKGYEATIFQYTQDDFKEKARVLKKGSFLVEFLPEMRESNIDYLMDVISHARSAGFKLYSKVPWVKFDPENGKSYSPNIGRKQVNEDVYIFSKGKPRKLRNRKQGSERRMEAGAKELLPAVFMEKPVMLNNRVHQAQKPSELLKKIICLLSNELEVVLDQFAGSFSTFWASLECRRHAVAIEINHDFIKKNFIDKKL